jgi:L-threonylcarbamoyladenylate synthase
MRILRAQGALDANVLAAATRCIASGGTLVFPTDTVYGIGCAPENERAVEAIFSAKHRPPTKPLAIHLAHSEDASAYAARLTDGARAIIERFWPGPVTIIVERNPLRCASAARTGSTIALRRPDDAACASILAATGPLAATSANLSGAAAFTGAEIDLKGLPEADLAIIAGPTKERRESTVLDCSTDVVRVVRAGALEPVDIAAALAGIAAFERSPRQ